MRETGTGQQVAQLHDRYMMMMMKTRRSPSQTSFPVQVSEAYKLSLSNQNTKGDA
jgi:hypothetical protein